MKLRIVTLIIVAFATASLGVLAIRSISQAKAASNVNNNVSPATNAEDGLSAKGKSSAAEARCFCRGSVDIGSNPSEVPDACIDWGTIYNYSGINPQNENNQKDCAERCSKLAEQDSKFNDDNWVCQNCYGKPGGYTLRAYSKVGTRDWRIAQTNSVNCCATGGEIKCPNGWIADANGPGNKKCKKDVCYVPEPCPPNNTKIGDWGFTWGCAIAQWGPATSINPVVIKSCQ